MSQLSINPSNFTDSIEELTIPQRLDVYYFYKNGHPGVAFRKLQLLVAAKFGHCLNYSSLHGMIRKFKIVEEKALTRKNEIDNNVQYCLNYRPFVHWLLFWVSSVGGRHVYINDEAFLDAAEYYSKWRPEPGKECIIRSDAWLTYFKYVHCISGRSSTIQNRKFDSGAAINSLSEIIAITKQFAPQDIYNLDDTLLNYHNSELEINRSTLFESSQPRPSKMTVAFIQNAAATSEKRLLFFC